MNSHVDWGRKIADLVIRQAVERSRSVQKVERKKSSSVVMLPEKLTDCESTEHRRERAFPRRRRFGGRLGQAGARQALPGDLQDARQGAQLVGSEARAPVLQRRDPRHRGGGRRRSARRGRRARSLGPALRQDRVDDRRRRRRRAHFSAAAHAFLPALPEADRARPHLRREPAALQDRHPGAGQARRRRSSTRSTKKSANRSSTARATKASKPSRSRSSASRAWAR